MMILLVLLILGGYAIYVMSPEERLRAARRLQDLAHDGADILAERRAMPEPFRDALRARTPLAYATGAIAAVMTIVWLFMTLGGAFSDPSGLIGWGASFGPLTTNGEWWRLGASVLVHAGFVHFVINMIGFGPLGIVVERMVGPVAFAVVFLAAGLFAGLESLSAMPMAVVAGADGAIFGIYGLFAAAVVWNIRRPPPEELLQLGDLRSSILETDAGDASETPEPQPLQMTREALIRLAPGAVIFVLYHAANGLQTSELSGLVGGFAAGLVLARRSSERTASLVQAGAVAVVALVVILGSAAMLKGIADVRPEIAKVVALESETAGQVREGSRPVQERRHLVAGAGEGDQPVDRPRASGGAGTAEGGERRAARTPAARLQRRGVPPPARRELAAAGGCAAQVEHGRVEGRGPLRTGVARSAREAQGRAREIVARPPGSSGRTNPPDSGHNRQACLCRSWSVPVPSLEIV